VSRPQRDPAAPAAGLMGGRVGCGIAIARVVLGAIFVMHGYLALAVVGPAEIAGYTIGMGYPAALAPALAWYLIVVHLTGGACLVLGLVTRWAALANLPIIASAFFLHHLPQGFFLHGILMTGAATVRRARLQSSPRLGRGPGGGPGRAGGSGGRRRRQR